MSAREKWPGRFTYMLAAIGFAAGLGNLWRFPMLAYEHGGAAFIVALVASNIFIAFPLVMFETVIGQKFQSGAPSSMEKLKKGSSWIQWIPLLGHIFVLMYYAPVMAWAVNFLFETITAGFPARPTAFFNDQILGKTEGVTQPGPIQTGLLLSLMATYIAVMFCLRNGLRSVSKVIRITATAPFLLLFIILVRSITLPGAAQGLTALFVPDWSALLDLKIWQAALGQSFFSAGLAFGYFTMSGSHREPNAEIPKTTIGILAGNLGVSILAGMAVFATLGFMAHQQGTPLNEVAEGGPTLVFSVLPEAIAVMPVFKTGMAILLFLVVITLAIDSIMGSVESVTAGFMDLKQNKSGEFKLTLLVLSISFLGGLAIISGAGTFYMDILDHFVGGYIFMLVGVLECIVGAWLIDPEKIRLWINETSDTFHIGPWFNWALRLNVIVVGGIFTTAIIGEFQGPYGGYPAWALILFGGAPLVIMITGAFVLNRVLAKRL